MVTIAVSLKYLSNFRRSLEIPSIKCEVELKLKWRKYSAFAAADNDNTNANPNNIIFTNKDTQLYVPIVSLINKR